MKNIPVRTIAVIEKELRFSESFTIRDVVTVLNGTDLTHDLHRHDFFFILALQKGDGLHEIDFTSYAVCDHSIFILRPGQVHQLKLKAGCTGFLMEFSPNFYHPTDAISSQRLNRASSKDFSVLEGGPFKKLLAVLQCIFHEFTTKQEAYLEVIKSNLAIFFIEFTRQIQNVNGKEKGNSSYIHERLEDFLSQLEINIFTLKQVSQYADLLSLSTYQLNAITKTAVGKSASQLINEQIILEAKRYLLASPSQIKDIADHLGYEDISYFIRFFKKHTGYSPEVFRKKFQ